MAHEAQNAVYVIVLLVASAALTLQLVLMLRRARSKRRSLSLRTSHAAVVQRSTTRQPIVLVHGWTDLDAVALVGAGHEYFRGVRARLVHAGHRVQLVRLTGATIAHRAEQLSEQLAALGGDYFNLVAHGVGGLDARYAITKLGVETRVVSLTTIGTPHQGTPLTDRSKWPQAGIALPRRIIASLDVNIDVEMSEETAMSFEHAWSFNKAVPNVPGVAYASYCGWLPVGSEQAHRLLAPSVSFLQQCAGDNDGIVPASSQRWGEVLGEVQADHWAQAGWSRRFDAERFYAELALGLARRGF